MFGVAPLQFDNYKINMAEVACQRLLNQFSNSTKGIQPFLSALIEQTQSLNDAELTVFTGRTVRQAFGVQLDILGSILGMRRPYITTNNANELWFTWDGQPLQYWDRGVWFQTGGTNITEQPIQDSYYRRLLLGKIVKNNVTGATLGELIWFNFVVFGVYTSAIDAIDTTNPANPMHIPATIDIVVPDTMRQFERDLITSSLRTPYVYHEYFVPIPSTVSIRSLISYTPTSRQRRNFKTEMD